MASFYLAANALVEKNGKYLMVEEGKEHVKGKWHIPGGGVESDEDPKTAIMREVKEETGLDIKQLNGLIAVLNGKSSKDEHPVLVLVFSAKVEDREPEPEFNEEILDAEFKTKKEIEELELRNDIFHRAIKQKDTDNLSLESLSEYGR